MLTSKYEEKICNIYLIHDKFFSVGYNFLLLCVASFWSRSCHCTGVWSCAAGFIPPVNERALNLP
jgi:hypothetical protein